jgi:hypothetical protein
MANIAPEVTPPRPRRLLGTWDGFCVVLLVLLWLLPMLYVGGFDDEVRAAPVFLRHQYRAAALFSDSVRSWSNYHMVVSRKGERVLEELPEDGYFDMGVFGYRTRLHRILGASSRSSRSRSARRQMKELAEFIYRRDRVLAPHEPPLSQIRFVRSWLTVEALARQEGHYVKPRLADVPPGSRRELARLRFDDQGQASHMDRTRRERRRRR